MTLKPQTHTKTLTEAEIDLIISEATLNPQSDEWEFSTDPEDLRFIQKTIRINGSIAIEKI